MNDHKNKKMLGTILKDIEHSITFKIKYERSEIQDVNVFNSINIQNINYEKKLLINYLKKKKSKFT